MAGTVTRGSRLFLLVFMGFAAFAFHAFVIRGDELAVKRYVDQGGVEFMDGLIEKGWIVVGKDGPALSQKAQSGLSASEIRKARQLLPGIEGPADRLRFNARYVSVVHPRISQGLDDALRGRIFDRRGRLLAGVDHHTGRRIYPLGPAAFHVVGYGGGLYPKAGLESVFDGVLGAENAPWWRKLWRGNRPLGRDIHLTIDAEIQKAAHAAMANRPGAVVVLAPATGEVLAMVSTPSFDPNLPPGKAWDLVAEDPKRPMINRAIAERYPPGSIFKLLVAAAGISSGPAPVMNVTRQDRALGISDRHAFDRLDFVMALAESSNVYFARWGVALGPALAAMCGQFGFMHPIILATGPDGATLAAIPSYGFFLGNPAQGEAVPFSDRDFQRNPRLVAQGAIGQNVVLATPLQMAMATAALANRGTMQSPRIVADAPGMSKSSQAASSPVPSAVVRQIVHAMCAVTDEGTGKGLKKIHKTTDGYSLVATPGAGRVRVAAKTGTAEVQGKGSHAWFVCFAPDEPLSPVVCVLVEHAGYGASNAGPVGIEVLGTALNVMAKEGRGELSDDI